MAVDKKISQLASGAPAQAGDEYVVARSGANFKLTLTNIAASMPPIGATTPNTGSFTSLTNSGNLNFSGTGQRITGDMSNATIANRLAFQTSTTNGNTDLNIIPNGTSVTSGIRLNNNSDTTNAGYVRMSLNSTEASISVDRNSVSGTYLPLGFNTGGSERMRLDTSGNLLLGTASNATGITTRFLTKSGSAYAASAVFESDGSALNWARTDWKNANIATTGIIYIDQGGEFAIRNDGNYPLSFYTNGANQRMTITGAGNVGIGTASPVAKLQSAGTSGLAQFRAGTASNGYFEVNAFDSNPVYCVVAGANATAGVFGTQSNIPTIFFSNNTERMRIDSSGNVGIGGTAIGNARCQILGTMPVLGGNTNSQSFFQNASVPSSITGTARGFSSTATTDASSFTLTKFVGFQANQGTIGSGSTVTTQVGFEAASTLTGATNNYGFYSDIASGSNRWNFYAAGTARNYFAGNIGVGADSAVVRVFARGANTASTDYVYYGENSAATLLFYVRNDGIFNTGVAANSPYNLTTANAANCFINSDGALYRSTSSLRYKTDVANAAHGLADVLKLRSVTYKAKNDGDKVFGGLIAEEVHDAGLTEFVAYDKEGRPDALHYGNMVALLIKAVQELKAELDALKAV